MRTNLGKTIELDGSLQSHLHAEVRELHVNELLGVQRTVIVAKGLVVAEDEVSTYRHTLTGFGITMPAVKAAWKMPRLLTRRVISRISTGATRFELKDAFYEKERSSHRSLLWTQRKLISTIRTVLS